MSANVWTKAKKKKNTYKRIEEFDAERKNEKGAKNDKITHQLYSWLLW